MKALIIVIASLLSAQAMAAATLEVKPLELGRPVEIGRPLQLQPIRPAVRATVAAPVVAAPVSATGVGAQAQCTGDVADQLVQGSGKLNVTQVREALRFFGTALDVGHCQGANKEAKGLLGYDLDARENLLLAAIEAMNDLKRQGINSASQSPTQARASLDRALAVNTSATSDSLKSCGIVKL